MRGEPPVELTLSQDSSLPRSACETNLKKAEGEQYLPPFHLAAEHVQCKRAGKCIIPNNHLKEHNQAYLLFSLCEDPMKGQATHHNLSTLLCQIRDGSRGEIEISSFERPQNHSVGHIACSERWKLRKTVSFQRKEGKEIGKRRVLCSYRQQTHLTLIHPTPFPQPDELHGDFTVCK